LTIGKPYTFSLDNTMSLVMVSSAIPTDDAEAMPLVDRKIEAVLLPLTEKYPDYRPWLQFDLHPRVKLWAAAYFPVGDERGQMGKLGVSGFIRLKVFF
jgi:hypothetical protein